jgi:type VI secretion system Hcp family effector
MKRAYGLWCVVVCVLVAGIVGLPAPARAWQAFAKITTTSGGTAIEGDSVVKGFEKQITVLGLGNDMQLPITSDPIGGISVGRLKLGPFRMVKAFDIATPKLIPLIVNSSSLKVEVTLFKTTATGTSVPGFKILLTNAFLTNMDTIYDPGATPSALEKIEFFYTKLTWTDLTTGLTGSTP